ncbi:MAG TPA: glutaredoxin family protein [Gammaproteobacteria bacterium]
MTTALLYSRPGCHLCEDMKLAVLPLLQAAKVGLDVVNIDDDAALREQYGVRIPVLTLDGEVIAEGRLDADAVRDALRIR